MLKKIFIQQTSARFEFISTNFAVFLYLLANFSSLASVYLTRLNSLAKPLNRAEGKKEVCLERTPLEFR